MPHVAKNLLSISKITKDNNVVVEFSTNGCIIKDNISQEVLLQGFLNNGLDVLQPN